MARKSRNYTEEFKKQIVALNRRILNGCKRSESKAQNKQNSRRSRMSFFDDEHNYANIQVEPNVKMTKAK